MATMLSFGRRSSPLVAALLLVTACSRQSADTMRPLSAADSSAIADSLSTLVKGAYDLSQGDVVRRMMSLYPDEGRVISATAGRVTLSRDSLASSVNAFWTGVGQFMVRPTWTWEAMDVDVLSRDAAVLTARYTVPHWTEENQAHVIGGVWTSIWQRRNGHWQVIHEHLSDMPRPVAERLEADMAGAAPADQHEH